MPGEKVQAFKGLAVPEADGHAANLVSVRAAMLFFSFMRKLPASLSLASTSIPMLVARAPASWDF
jgi:hypothetical protein